MKLRQPKLIKQLFCKHNNSQFIRNIYGDEIIGLGWKRSIWSCDDCSKIYGKDELNKSDIKLEGE